VQLRDGRLLLIYSKFTGGVRDASAAHLASRVSTMAARHGPSKMMVVVPNEGTRNVIVGFIESFGRRPDCPLYLRKNSLQDCLPCIRFSTDECEDVGSEPTVMITKTPRSVTTILNNDRVCS